MRRDVMKHSGAVLPIAHLLVLFPLLTAAGWLGGGNFGWFFGALLAADVLSLGLLERYIRRRLHQRQCLDASNAPPALVPDSDDRDDAP